MSRTLDTFFAPQPVSRRHCPQRPADQHPADRGRAGIVCAQLQPAIRTFGGHPEPDCQSGRHHPGHRLNPAGGQNIGAGQRPARRPQRHRVKRCGGVLVLQQSGSGSYTWCPAEGADPGRREHQCQCGGRRLGSGRLRQRKPQQRRRRAG